MNRDSLEWQWHNYVSITPSFRRLLVRLTHRQPKERYQSAQEVLEAITPLLHSDEVSSPLPQSMLTTTRIDLSVDPNAAPIFNAPMQPGAASALHDEAFVARCRQELTRCIGPMASFVVEDALDQHPNASPQELVEILASQLSDGKQASQFMSSIDVPPQPLIAPERSSQSASMAQPRSQQNSGAAIASLGISQANVSAASVDESSTLSPAFIDSCRQVLTQCIGPMASVLLEDALEDFGHLSPSEFVAQLATEIPDPRKAQEFQQRLQ
jgi:serine/threonine-protein kinase